jgi:hypothetical protein
MAANLEMTSSWLWQNFAGRSLWKRRHQAPPEKVTWAGRNAMRRMVFCHAFGFNSLPQRSGQ